MNEKRFSMVFTLALVLVALVACINIWLAVQNMPRHEYMTRDEVEAYVDSALSVYD